MQPHVSIITEDHLHGPGARRPDPEFDTTRALIYVQTDESSRTMRRMLTDGALYLFPDVHSARFCLSDDDGIVYYTGWLYWSGDPDGPEDDVTEALYGWGERDSGTVLLSFPDHPDWDIG